VVLSTTPSSSQLGAHWRSGMIDKQPPPLELRPGALRQARLIPCSRFKPGRTAQRSPLRRALALSPQKNAPAAAEPARMLCQALRARSSWVSALSRWTRTNTGVSHCSFARMQRSVCRRPRARHSADSASNPREPGPRPSCSKQPDRRPGVDGSRRCRPTAIPCERIVTCTPDFAARHVAWVPACGSARSSPRP
jgi:hypothetical protein